jgi:glycosyltransferase involved in cell wall biosynthesis
VVTISILIYAAIETVLLVAVSVRLQLALWRFRVKKSYTAAVTAPSVSVCIPARNEMHAMTQCLERVLASDYRKLEVIVFDDSSGDDTSVLIKSFAHAGVRFVPGSQLPDGWLGKNHALEILAREASGTYVLFLDVDTYIIPTTISQLVGYTMTENAEMISVIPGRSDGWRMSVLFGHLRYLWELILSRRSAPATASSLWMIRRTSLLDRFGGFGSLKANVAPERALASAFGNQYRCLINTTTLGINYEKRWRSQLETSRRLLYPMIGSSPLRAGIVFVVLLLIVSPFFVVLSSLLFGWGILQLEGVWILVAFMGVYGVLTSHLWRRGWWLGAVLWPAVIIQETILFTASVVGYIRGTITWKGRPVTAKVLHSRAINIDK